MANNRESTLRAQFRHWCKDHGYMQIALTGVSLNGCPDVYLVDLNLFIEFKRKGGKRSKIQEYIAKEINNHGGTCIMAQSIKDIDDWRDLAMK